jgi:cobalt-zinc-cadmium efflux system membrane fusion protein
MTTTRHVPPPTAGRGHDPSEGLPPRPARRGRPSTLRRSVAALFLVATAAGASYATWRFPDRVRLAWESLAGKGAPQRVTSAETAGESRFGQPWDGSITVSAKARTAMGLVTDKAAPQEDPIRLELLGTTENISDSLTKVRPMFKGRVDKVHVTVSQAVKKGDALIDFYSKELAESKSAYEIERIQWVHDKNILELRERLVKSNAVSQFLYEETKNSEMKSRKEYAVARDKLLLYGLSEAEIDKIDDEPGSQKARMTLRSSTDGFVIERDVVQGNLYDENDTLLVIAPLDRLWVWGNVFESDLDLVRLGQSWEIRFPFLEHKLQGKVEYISNRVDPNSHAVRIRTSIPNRDGKLKSDMLVRGMLEIPPAPGRTVIPRTALIVDDGRYYVFVQDERDPEKFRRRAVGVAQEKDDHVVIDDGLKAGEEVVSVGGLILAQIYEDLNTVQTGAPAASHAPGAG